MISVFAYAWNVSARVSWILRSVNLSQQHLGYPNCLLKIDPRILEYTLFVHWSVNNNSKVIIDSSFPHEQQFYSCSELCSIPIDQVRYPPISSMILSHRWIVIRTVKYIDRGELHRSRDSKVLRVPFLKKKKNKEKTMTTKNNKNSPTNDK